MALTRSRRPAVTSPMDRSLAAVTPQPERRRRRSRLPAIVVAVGFVAGTLLADVVVLSVSGGSGVLGAWSRVSLTDTGSWGTALIALRDPAVALASLAIGGVPGAMAGHRVAVNRLRRDRLEAWLGDRAGE